MNEFEALEKAKECIANAENSPQMLYAISRALMAIFWLLMAMYIGGGRW